MVAFNVLSLMSVALGLLVSAALATSPLNSPLCRQTRNLTAIGTCIPYPSLGICRNLLAGQSVYLALVPGQLINETFAQQEVFAITFMALLRANKGLVDDACLQAGDAYACHSAYPNCTLASGSGFEGIPALPCASSCQALWSACRIPFNQFNIGTILGTKTFNVKDFSFAHCPNGQFGVGTFDDGPQPQDVFGERFIRAMGPIPAGYIGQPRTPVASAAFKLSNNSVVNVQCLSFPPAPSVTDISAIVPPPQCVFPLTSDGDKCVIPCPFPVISEDQQVSIGNAFVVPAFFALFFCIFVFCDSVFVIAESQGFNDLMQYRKKLLRKGVSESDNSFSNTGPGTGVGNTSGSKRRRNQLRAATVYSLLGASLGIIFFFLGPMITLIRKEKVSCGVNPVTIDLGDLTRGNADVSDSYCRAQRVSPFILQMIFNLILYAIVRVFLVVTEKARYWSEKRKLAFDTLLVSYCVGIPILFLIVAMSKDRLSINVVDFITQFSRNSAICVARLSVTDEVILIFMPFIITGVVITWLSLYIYMHLNQISKGVNGLAGDAKKNSSTVALRLLMIRLSVLGIATFCVLLIFIAASGSLMAAMARFAPRFNAFFGCQAVKSSQCQSCEGETALMLEAIPSSAAFAAQIAAMSSISLLFGGFFAAQSFARLYKEYQDGILQIKLGNLWHGRPLGFRPAAFETSMQSFSQMGEKLGETRDAVKESCLAMWYGRIKSWRNSLRGRARGEVFRWQNNGPATKKKGKVEKKKFDFVPRSWNSKKAAAPPGSPVGDKWQGVVAPGETDDSSDLPGSSNAWSSAKKKVSYTESWASPQGMSSWNNGFQPSEGNDRDSPADSESAEGDNSVNKAFPKFAVADDDEDDREYPRRPPSRCPSI